jgi:hypothetical protein
MYSIFMYKFKLIKKKKMPQTCVVPLFTKKGEPSAILQCSGSGEYFCFFQSWKHAVHFLAWEEFKYQSKKDVNIDNISKMGIKLY